VPREQFQPTLEGEARLLLLIATFSAGAGVLEGRTKLAKLDFLLRYPEYFRRALGIRRPGLTADTVDETEPDIESTMVRYRYGPWDPSYFALLGRLIGKGLIQPVPYKRGLGYKATATGQRLAGALRTEPAWQEVNDRALLLKRHFDLSGAALKQFVYDHFPEVTQAKWGDVL
jgi:hypothetical protein